MKYLKLFENFQYGSISELEDNFIELIDSGMIVKDENGKTFVIELVRKTGGGKWIPTHYSVKIKLNIKAIKTLEDLEDTKNLYDIVYQSVYRLGGDFNLNKNNLSIYIPVSDSVKNFFQQWSIGKDEIDLNPQPKGDYWGQRVILPFPVLKIEDDFSIIFFKQTRGEKDYDQILKFVSDKVASGTGYDAEVYGKKNQRIAIQGGSDFHIFYIKVKP